MAKFEKEALDAVKLQTIEALANYGSSVQLLVETWLDMALYAEVSDKIEEIRRYCLLLPRLSVRWTALLISHAELMHLLWLRDHVGPPYGTNEIQLHLSQHMERIQALSATCWRELGKPFPPPA